METGHLRELPSLVRIQVLSWLGLMGPPELQGTAPPIVMAFLKQPARQGLQAGPETPMSNAGPRAPCLPD